MKYVFILIFSVLSLNYVFTTENPVAIVTSVDGTAHRIKANSNKKEQLVLGLQLYKDDLVSVEKGKVIVFYNNGNILILNEGEELIIGVDFTNSIRSGKNSSRTLIEKDIISKSKEKLSINHKTSNELAMLTPAGLRALGVNPVGPLGYVYNSQIIFSWIDSTSKQSEEREYVIIIMDGDLNELHRTTIRGKTLILNKIKLEDFVPNHSISSQQFYWDIFIKGNEPKKVTHFDLEASFLLIDKAKYGYIIETMSGYQDDFHKNKIDKSTLHLLSGLFLKDQKLYYEAIGEMESLVNLSPKYKYPYEEIAELYSILGKTSGVMVGAYLKLANLVVN
jgi:hypothetical protein